MESAYETQQNGNHRSAAHPHCLMGETGLVIMGCAGSLNSMSEATNGKYQWTVRINALNYWMSIGICQIRQSAITSV